jgi:small-conductance mechanosensitive channel
MVLDMKKIVLILSLLISTLFSADVITQHVRGVEQREAIELQKENILKAKEERLKQEKEIERKEKIAQYLAELKIIENEIAQEKVWMKSYSSYMTSLKIKEELKEIQKRIKFLEKRKKSIDEFDEYNSLISKENILKTQDRKLNEKHSAPFSKLLTPPPVSDSLEITNPIDIFTGLSTIKKQSADLQEYMTRKSKLQELIKLLAKENAIYEKIALLDKEKKYTKKHKDKIKQIRRFETAFETSRVTADIYQNRLEINEINIKKGIKEQMYKVIKIAIVIIVVFILFFLIKMAIKKYITDNERFYMANKIINFSNFTLIILILFFNYIENVSYLVTILGFASAGIAIAMKDWFMSMLGWLVIVIGGSIHVGDRIRVDMDGMRYVGDVMDISLLRMTILEDITLTSIMQNRRAGRIIFIPNNYVFTRMIANYTHSSLKTVWDGVHVTITFDSNHKKAMHLAKEIVKKYSKGYTDITRKQLNKLRNNYSLKNTNVEPRIFSFIESNGVSIDSWYLTNAYATLTLRSVISLEIIDAFKAEDDITIAYPTQKLHIEGEKLEPPFDKDEIV